MNTADQKFRLVFSVEGNVTEIATTGDKLLETLGQIPDSVIAVTIVDLNRLELLADDGYFFYWMNTKRCFGHMIDTALFPASKVACDWWNAHADEQVAIRCGFKIDATVTCIKDGAKLKGTVTEMNGGNAKILWQVPGLWAPDGIWYTRHQVMEMGILVGEPTGTPVLEAGK